MATTPTPELTSVPAHDATHAPATAPLPALLLLGALLVLLALGLWRLDTAPAEIDVTAPPLPVSQAACDVSTDAALAQAAQSEAAALARIARYPFDATEGLAALHLLAQAEACYATAGREQDRTRAAARTGAWRARIERDYRDHLTRYRRAILAQRPALARDDVSFLLELLAGHDGPFPARLRRLQREQEADLPVEDRP